MAPVPKKQKPLGTHFLRRWRDYREMKQEPVAAIIGYDKGLLSKMENSKTPYTQYSLEALARLYEATPAALLSIDPLTPSNSSIQNMLDGVEIKTPEDIEFLLRSIPGLDEDDVKLALGVILRALRANSAEPGQIQSGDQFQSATGRRESESSR